ncbi:cactus-binding C-terminus of cactin protein-domain-containing protein [Dipodascopsis tothii]|uniref:cactus-binding C-terminus of cactin protein-domain-containing protein n=1 Tax=Dipodascopsis tothii TaxID=44089 RepID=UPI0034CD1383
MDRRRRRHETESEQARRWVESEDLFVLQQARKGALIRIRENRARAVDWLAHNFAVLDALDHPSVEDDIAEQTAEVRRARDVIAGVADADVAALVDGIRNYIALEAGTGNRADWEAMLVLAERRQQPADSRAMGTVAPDVAAVLDGKNYAELLALEEKVDRLTASDSTLDVDFWNELRRQLVVAKAEERLRVLRRRVLATLATLVRDQQRREAELARQRLSAAVRRQGAAGPVVYEAEMDALAAEDAGEAAAGGTEARLAGRRARVVARVFVPRQRSAQARAPTPEPAAAAAAAAAAAERAFEAVATADASANDEDFADEVATESDSRLVKPRYFNRVIMGFDWNRYNQTHYSQSNPPPKTVQGYKFSIFYPELAGSAHAPTYKLVRPKGRRRGLAPPGEDETCVIRFIAGPPYQDVGFRIVDREWDYSARRESGFRSSFDKGILQLHFRFKKIYYRK